MCTKVWWKWWQRLIIIKIVQGIISKEIGLHEDGLQILKCRADSTEVLLWWLPLRWLP